MAGWGGSSETSAGSSVRDPLLQFSIASGLEDLPAAGGVLCEPAARRIRHVSDRRHHDQPVPTRLRFSQCPVIDQIEGVPGVQNRRDRRPDEIADAAPEIQIAAARRPDHRPRIVGRRVERDVRGRRALAEQKLTRWRYRDVSGITGHHGFLSE